MSKNQNKIDRLKIPLSFGKHKGKTLEEIIQIDTEYAIKYSRKQKGKIKNLVKNKPVHFVISKRWAKPPFLPLSGPST